MEATQYLCKSGGRETALFYSPHTLNLHYNKGAFSHIFCALFLKGVYCHLKGNSRESGSKSDKLPQVMSFESASVGTG